MRTIVTFLPLVFILFGPSGVFLQRPCGDWEPYKEEYCFKYFDSSKLVNFDFATALCEANSAHLPVIRYAEEQEFLKNYLFKWNHVSQHVWIGAKFDSVGSKFKWHDESEMTFTNWAVGQPQANSSNYCVQMDNKQLGQWVATSCSTPNAIVVCEKDQPRSMEVLEETVIALKHNMMEMQAKLGQLEASFVGAQKQWSRIEPNEVRLGQLEAKLNQIETKSTTNAQKLTASEYKVAKIEKALLQVDQKLTQTETKSTLNEQKLAKAEEMLNQTETKVTLNQQNLSQAEKRQSQLEQRLAQTEKKLTQAEQTLAISTQNKEKLVKELTQLKQQLVLAEQKLNQTEIKSTLNQQLVIVLEKELLKFATSMSQSEKRLAQVEAKSTVDQQNLALAQQKLSQIEKKLNQTTLSEQQANDKLTQLEKSVTQIQTKSTQHEQMLSQTDRLLLQTDQKLTQTTKISIQNQQYMILSEKKFRELGTKLAEAESTLRQPAVVPIGFIYTQLPFEKSPVEIWPAQTWTDVSDTYSGLFFRVEGGEAASFGVIQEANSTHVDKVAASYGEKCELTTGQTTALRAGHWSKPIHTGDNCQQRSGGDDYYDGHRRRQIDYGYSLKLYTSAGEIRPRNMAMRIWKRTA